jgi:hypothetical protein
LGVLGAASLGLLAYTGSQFVSGRTDRSLRPLAPAPQVGTAAATTGAPAVAEASPNPDRSSPPDRPPAAGQGATAGATADLTLPKEQREYLWQVEHHGLVLSRRGFPRIAKALKDDDARALLALFADGFEGEAPGRPREVWFEREAIRVVREQDSGQPPVRLDRDGLARRLLDDRRRFARPPTVKLALMALAPVDGKDLDGVWQGTCQLRMFGDMGPGRLGEVVLSLRYRLPRPTEERLGSDGWLRSIAITQRQVAESPRLLMREVAAERGINVKRFHDNWANPERTRIVAGGMNLCDFNRDGCLDLLITDLSANVLYQGRPDGTFADVTQQVHLPRSQWLINATFADLDGDGWEDLIYGSVILRNNEGRSFSMVHSPGFALQNPANLAVADYDRDGKLDLYETIPGLGKAASWIKGKAGGRLHNRLWRNLGNWQFADVTESSGTAGGNRSTFSAVWLDADEDGWPDLYVINEFGDGVLLVNQADGTFRERSIAPSPGDFGSMGLTAGDFDNDGHVDLYVANMYSKAGNRIMANLRPGSYPEETLVQLRSFTVGSQLHRNLGGLKFEQVGRELQVADVGWAFGPALVDLDNDGYLDIYATCGFISRSRDDPDG